MTHESTHAATAAAAAPAYMTTGEVAAYLRLKERKVYDLARQGVIPCIKITGKLLFPRDAIDHWLMSHLEGDQAPARDVAAILGGSHDPLLDWAVRETGHELAMRCRGSADGAHQLLSGDVMVAGIHVIDTVTGEHNRPESLGLAGMRDLLMIRWARRRQGLLVAPGNPAGVATLADLARLQLRVGQRQPEAGAHRLLQWLMHQAGIPPEEIGFAGEPALSEDDLALAIRQGRVDAGLAVEASARRHGLGFLPLYTEPFDLALRRRSYFEPPIQRLLEFARGERCRRHAEALGGYDLSGTGEVIYNA